MRRMILVSTVLVALVLALAPVASADPPPHRFFPTVIRLPDGFQPEGIVMDEEGHFWVGSVATGAIFAGNVLTGEGDFLVPPQEDRLATGLAFDERTNYLFVSGASTGAAYVYDATTGDEIATFQLADPGTVEFGTFVNDVVVTPGAAYFTDSFRPFIYRLPLDLDGNLPDPTAVEEIALGGEFEFVPDAFNANGIEATFGGRWLVIVNSALGALYRVDPQTGEATLIDLGGETVLNGDGLVLDGRRLYVVQNALEQVAVVQLNLQLDAGEVLGHIRSRLFRFPTTAAGFGPLLYAVNARFDVEPGPDVAYEVVRVFKFPRRLGR